MDSGHRCLLVVSEGMEWDASAGSRGQGLLPEQWWPIEGSAIRLEFPLASARIATLVSAYTGAWPHTHGIVSAETRTPEGLFRPVSGTDRHSPAIWEIVDRAGLPSVVVGWPASITGDAQHSSQVQAGFGTAVPPDIPLDLSECVHPPRLVDSLRDCWLGPGELGSNLIGELVPGWKKVNQAVDLRLASLAMVLAENASRHAAFLELLTSQPWALASLCLSLPAELASLERLSEPLADGLFEGLARRALPLMTEFLRSIQARVPDGINIVLAGLPHPETPDRPGFVWLTGPAFSNLERPSALSVIHLAPLVASACGVTHSEGQSATSRLPDFSALLTVSNPILKRYGESPTQAELWHYNALQVVAASHTAQNDPLSALPYWDALTRLVPNDYEKKLQLAECQRRLGLVEVARDSAYAAIHPQHRADPRPLLTAAGIEIQLGGTARARELLRRAEPNLGDSTHLRFQFAKISARVGEWEKAAAILEKLVLERPDDSAARFLLARCEIARRNWQSALDHALRVSQVGPPNARTLELMAHAFLGFGMREQARQALESACALAPEWPRPRAKRYLLARACEESPEQLQLLLEDYKHVRQKADERHRARIESARARQRECS